MSEAAIEAMLRRDRAIVAAALVILTALAWAYVWWLAADMDMSGMDMSGFSNRPFRVKRFSDYPPLQCRCRSRARASLRNRHQGPFHHGIRGRGGTIFRAALPSDER